MENGIYSTSAFQPDQRANVQDNNLNGPSIPSTSNSESSNVSQNYSSYGAYQTSDAYGYGNTGYAGYYSEYQQQPNQSYGQPNQSYGQPSQSYTQPVQSYVQPVQQSYVQPVGAYQSTGAPQQPNSSFQNTGSYAMPVNYSSTYYGPADYQTSGVYANYNNQSQTNSWQQGNYADYANQHSNYTPESNGAYSASNSGASSVQYQQHYKQWADYYSQTEVACAPGTENISATSAVNTSISVPGVPSGYSSTNSQQLAAGVPGGYSSNNSQQAAAGVPGGYSSMNSQQPAAGVPGGYSSTNSQQPLAFTQSWRPEPTSSALPSMQPSAVISNVHDTYWKHGTPAFQNHNVRPIQPKVQTPLDSNRPYGNFQEQQKPEYTQGSNVHYLPTHQAPQNYHTPLQTVQQTVSQTPIPLDSRVSKMQIPTNPRIATNLAFGSSKTGKDNSVTSATAKPAYISVPPPKPIDQVSSHVAADSILKPGMFPKSLRGYVERALSRCKDDTQMAACQAVMKEVITKATADGTLYTRDWDTEPLFPLPSAHALNNEGLQQSSTPISSLSKNRRSPSRRSKSRWEPLSMEKSVDKLASLTPEVKHGGWSNLSLGNNKFLAGKSDKVNNWGNLKLSSPDQKATNKNTQRPAKRQRLGDGPSVADNGGASSDSDKEQNLTAYYAGAIALDTPEERKRRESRSKRFEKARGARAVNNHIRPKNVRATPLVLRKNFVEGGNRAVEDMDWDSLTVKGTCHEIEKRYLRLTSAPDPATVRPEEVLVEALVMVQNSQKNYLYKCDQLKSIRQDLTVQRIRNELTVKVYETHARLAIEVGDLSEYNQCQSQLQVLYSEGNMGCDMEFSAYNLLCAILHSNNNRDLLSAMSRLSVEAKKDEAVKHALAVRAAVTSGNYVLFFRLYKEAPNLSTCLMDLYVEKMRYAAVKCMSRSYRPTVPVSYIAQVLGFSSLLETSDEKDTDGLEECVEWLKAHGACLLPDNPVEMLLDTKASTSSLFMPEPDDAVAHGDATLAVNDFLTRIPS